MLMADEALASGSYHTGTKCSRRIARRRRRPLLSQHLQRRRNKHPNPLVRRQNHRYPILRRLIAWPTGHTRPLRNPHIKVSLAAHPPDDWHTA